MDDAQTQSVILKHAAAVFSIGAAGRLIMALHGGERRSVTLLIEAMLGGLLGLMAGTLIAATMPSLRDAGWGLYVVSGAAGWAGTMGTRLLDIATEYLRIRAGIKKDEKDAAKVDSDGPR